MKIHQLLNHFGQSYVFCQREYPRHASVKIDYLDERLKNLLADESKITKKYGEQVLKQVKRRMRALKLAPNLEELWKQRGGGLHFLSRDRKDQLAYHVGGKRRFIFTPNHDPLPLLDDGGINRKEVTCVTILAIAEDYHRS